VSVSAEITCQGDSTGPSRRTIAAAARRVLRGRQRFGLPQLTIGPSSASCSWAIWAAKAHSSAARCLSGEPATNRRGGQTQRCGDATVTDAGRLSRQRRTDDLDQVEAANRA
jgi:hypothetical protein